MECRRRGLVEDGILATCALADQLNERQSRSREWSAFWVGQVMGRLGFEPTRTPVTYQRGWRINQANSPDFKPSESPDLESQATLLVKI